MKHMNKKILLYFCAIFLLSTSMYSKYIVKQGVTSSGQPYYYTVSVPTGQTDSQTGNNPTGNNPTGNNPTGNNPTGVNQNPIGKNTSQEEAARKAAEAEKKRAAEEAEKQRAAEEEKKKAEEDSKVYEVYIDKDKTQTNPPESSPQNDYEEPNKPSDDAVDNNKKTEPEEERKSGEEEKKSEEEEKKPVRILELAAIVEEVVPDLEAEARLEEERRRTEYEEEIRKKQEEIARDAEVAEEAAIAKYLGIKKSYDAVMEKMNKIDKLTVSERNNLIREYEIIMNQYKTAQNHLKRNAEAMTKAYEQLAEAYAKYGYSGDPVHISTGDYLCEYTDFVAVDYLNKFSVKRNLTNQNYAGSFGQGWNCSLDSRIIRCTNDFWNRYEPYVKECHELVYQMKQCLNVYRSMYSNYITHEFLECFREANDYECNLERIDNLIQESKESFQKMCERNKYVTYGKYADPASYCGTEDQLILVDTDGFEYSFYKEDDIWKSAGQLSSPNIYIEETPEGRYEVWFPDGKIRQYSYYGILMQDFDRDFYTNVNSEIENGKINALWTKNNERIEIQRNEAGYITSICGEISGKTEYFYEGDKLRKVIDNEGISVSFDYNEQGFLSRINKADETSIEIFYEYNSAFGKYVCSEVKNESGKSEYFDWKNDLNTMIHTTVDGKKEKYIYNSQGNPVYIEDCYGNELQFETDDNGLITSFSKNGLKRYFTYDEKYRPVSIELENGAVTKIDYNILDQIVSITDPDGFEITYGYDCWSRLEGIYNSDGSAIRKYSFNDDWRLEEVKENGVTIKYEYNIFSSVSKETVSTSNKELYTKTWEYDLKNKPAKYIDESGFITEITYDDNSRTEIFDNKRKTVTVYDSKNREIELTTTDLLTGISYRKNTIYDERGNVIAILYDDIVSEEFYYLDNNQIYKKILWEMDQTGIGDNKKIRKGILTDYVYDERGNLRSEKTSYIYENTRDTWGQINYKEITIEKSNNERIVTEKYYTGKTIKSYYNIYNQLVKKEYSDGIVEKYTYSKAGRLKSITDNKNSSYEYKYNSDGTYKIIYQNGNGNSQIAEINSFGKIQTLKNLYGIVCEYEYDHFGNLKAEKTPVANKNYEYDLFGRLIREVIYDNKAIQNNICFDKQIYYDDENRIVSIMNNNACMELLCLDVWGRPVEVSNKYGRKRYSYDVFSRVIKETDANGCYTLYGYDGASNLCNIKKSDGTEYSIERNSAGQITKYLRNGMEIGNVSFDYDKRYCQIKNEYQDVTAYSYNQYGNLLERVNPKTGVEKYEWSNENNFVRITNNNGFYEYNLDAKGNVVKEKNYEGNCAEYSYDDYNRLIGRINFDGTRDSFTYDDENNCINYSFATGEKSKITRNALGLITSIVNEDCNYKYEYDSYGRIKRYSDLNTLINIDYSYDEFGRCVEKRSNSFDYVYDYDNCGRIFQIKELISDVLISFDYDSSGKEIYRSYSSGVSISKNYDANGLLQSVVSKNKDNEILTANFLVRNSDGKIVLVYDEKGTWKKVEYSSNGVVKKFLYPYSENIVDYYFSEAKDCGVYVKDMNPAGEFYHLTEDELDEIEAIIQNNGLGNVIPVIEKQKCWEEILSYNGKGSIESTENGFGKIIYEYDGMNRLVAKYGSNSRMNGMKFEWDEKGNMTLLDSIGYSIEFNYGAYNRPVLATYRNKVTSEETFLSYTYDALGRRVSETRNYTDSITYVYDAFSLEVIQTTPVLRNKTAMTNYVSSIVSKSNESKNRRNVSENAYRWIDDADYNANVNLRTISTEDYNESGNNRDFRDMEKESSISLTAKDYSEERPYSVLYYKSFPIAYFYVDDTKYSGLDYEFVVSDAFNNSTIMVNASAEYESKNIYDWWGNNLTGTGNVCFSGNSTKMDLPLTVYNLGFRDYCPALKCFTSQDPIRDGYNWYSYCSGDTVNYHDLNGLDVVPVTLTYLMTDYPDDILLGNSLKDKLNAEGCYLVTLANIALELQKYGVIGNEDYDSPIKINEHKELFDTSAENGGNIYRNKSMDVICEDRFNDYWTKEVSTTAVIQAQLAKAAAVQDQFIVIAVFDLSAAKDGVKNHMVVLNTNFNEDGKLTSANDITGSSANDYRRIMEGYLDVYNLDNVKELRIINTGTKACNK